MFNKERWFEFNLVIFSIELKGQFFHKNHLTMVNGIHSFPVGTTQLRTNLIHILTFIPFIIIPSTMIHCK